MLLISPPRARIRISLIARGDEGELFINGKSQGTIDLGAVDFTQVWLVVGTEEPGQATRFQDFSIWKWHPVTGESSRKNPHSGAGLV